ncbi:hypothetical protein MW887_001507 [Aspergillus wentii]|nr:hypothetical protein MW887_001507 [Aspergillus wentii]
MPEKPTTFPDLLDVLIIGAGPCGLAVAARLNEETPSAMFTDEEHQRYHWISKHSGRMALVQARHHKLNSVKADKWQPNAGDNARTRSVSSISTESTPSLASSAGSSDESDDSIDSPASLSTLVLDGTGDRFLERWNRAFKTLEIAQLRSPMFFHPDPGDRDGMLAYTQETGREKDLWEIPNCVGKEMSKHKKKKKQRSKQTIGQEIDERDRKDYFSPSTDLFADYCASIISRYKLDRPGKVLQREVTDIVYDYHPDLSPSEKIFTVTASDGSRFYSRTTVLAIGPGTTKILPFPLSEEEKNGGCHSSEIRSFPSMNVKRKIQQRQETNVMVVGGGLSSAQIVDMAIRKGVSKVWFLMRSDFKVKHFDIDLTWMGKFKNYEKAVFWSADTDEGTAHPPNYLHSHEKRLTEPERLEMIKTARNGGSITPRYQKIVKHHAARHRASIHTRTVIVDRKYCPASQTWRLTTDPPIPDLPPMDYIYFATGIQADVNELPLLQSMNRDYPIETKGGLPCVTDDLMWRPGLPLFVTGRLGALRLGPGAPNLEGARTGAERIAWGMDEVLGRKEVEEDDGMEFSKECFCGFGNRYAGLDVSL